MARFGKYFSTLATLRCADIKNPLVRSVIKRVSNQCNLLFECYFPEAKGGKISISMKKNKTKQEYNNLTLTKMEANKWFCTPLRVVNDCDAVKKN